MPSRRRLRDLLLGSSLSESQSAGVGGVSALIGALEAMNVESEQRRQRRRLMSVSPRAQRSQEAGLLPTQQSALQPFKGGLGVRVSGTGVDSGGGKSLGGFLSNLLGVNEGSGLAGAFLGLPQGAYEVGKAAWEDIKNPGMQGIHTKQAVVDPTVESYKHIYGPLLPGGEDTFNFGKFWNRVYKAPLQPVLDVAALASVGGTAAVKAAGAARYAGARGPVSDALIGLGNVEGRRGLPLGRAPGEGVEVPELERRYSPSMNRRLFQRFAGDPLSSLLGGKSEGWRGMVTSRALRGLARQQSSLKNITEQHAVEQAVQGLLPVLEQGTLLDRAVARMTKGRAPGLSPDEQQALTLRKRGITPQPLKTKTFDDPNVEMVPTEALLEGDIHTARGIEHRSEGYMADLRKSIEEEGITRPVILHYDPGSRRAAIVDGKHRMELAREMGVKQVPVRVDVVEPGSYGETATRYASGGEVPGHAEGTTPVKPSDIGLPGRPTSEPTLLGRAQALWQRELSNPELENVRTGVPPEYAESLINLSPRVRELIENPTPAMLDASRAWDAAIEHQRGRLGISPEEHRNRVWAVQSLLRGGRSAEELEAEFGQWAAAQGGDVIAPNYVPDIPAENLKVGRSGELEPKQKIRTRDPSARAAVERSFAPPRQAYMEDTDLTAFRAAVFRTDTQSLLTHLAKVEADLNQNFFTLDAIEKVGMRGPDGDLLKIKERDLHKVTGQDPLKPEWSWVPADIPVRFFNQEINHLEEMIKIVEDNPDLDSDSLLEQLNTLNETEGRAFMQEVLAATKADGYVVPRSWKEYTEKLDSVQDFKPTGVMGAYASAINKWRTMTLAYMPRWWVNTAVGSFALAMLKGVWDPRAYYQAARLMGRGKVPPGIALGGGVIRAELHHGGQMGGVTGREFFPTRKIYKNVQKIEDFFRTASGLQSLDKLEKQALREMEGSMRHFARPMTGLADDEYVQYLLSDSKRVETAMDEVNKFSYNFMQLGPIERKYVRNFGVPFWGWYKFVTKLVWTLPFDYPGRTLVIQKLGEIGAESESDISDWMPAWMKGAVLWNKQDPENVKYMTMYGLNPFSEFANPFDREGFIPGLLKAAQLAPPLQAAISSAGIDPMTLEQVPIAPDAGVSTDFFGQLMRGNEEVAPGSVRGVNRFLGSLLRSVPQMRNLELWNTEGRPVYPESIPFISEKPMDVRPETQRSMADLLLGSLGVNVRERNIRSDEELLRKRGAYASAKSRRAAARYLDFLRREYSR